VHNEEAGRTADVDHNIQQGFPAAAEETRPQRQHESKRRLLGQHRCESFFGSLKQERVQWRSYQTRYEAQQDVLHYITMFYNSHHFHSTLV